VTIDEIKDLMQWCIDSKAVTYLKVDGLEVRLAEALDVSSETYITTEQAMDHLSKAGNVSPDRLRDLSNKLAEDEQYYSSS